MRTIHHVLDIDAGHLNVWEALVSPVGLAGWWSTELEASDPAVGEQIRFTFSGDFNPVMEVIGLIEGQELRWKCISGHQNWQDNTFIFELVPREGGGTRLRFTQDYATELSDDDYGIYNFNWGYYLESLRLLCVTGAGKPYGPSADG